jgi:hypothetical protein
MRFAAALLAALVSFVAVPNAALGAAPPRHGQAPGFYRLQVGDFEVTALYDGTGVFDPHWLNGTKATIAVKQPPAKREIKDAGKCSIRSLPSFPRPASSGRSYFG